MIHHVDIEFALLGKTRQSQVAAAQVRDSRIQEVVSKEQVQLGMQRVSKPGLRVYTKATDVPRVLGGMGIAILSTNQGLMTDREARQRRVGGEILCHVW
jgi:ribosomal protein S8